MAHLQSCLEPGGMARSEPVAVRKGAKGILPPLQVLPRYKKYPNRMTTSRNSTTTLKSILFRAHSDFPHQERASARGDPEQLSVKGVKIKFREEVRRLVAFFCYVTAIVT